MLAIVAAIGSIILVQGMQGITNFTASLVTFGSDQQQSVRESLAIEHVRFDPDSDDVYIYYRNTGTVEINIESVTITRIDDQSLILHNRTGGSGGNQKIPIDSFVGVKYEADGTLPNQWKNSPYNDKKYRITVSTTGGNIFETTATPFNT
ncbi:MAG: hypothetical protein ACREAG_01155 [Nitrosopumilaceae archaeon]